MFDNSRLKIERAKEHISNLNAEISAFIGRNPYRVIPDIDPQTGKHFLKAEQVESIPIRFSVIIGDAIHNLRTALDLLACDLVVKYGGTADKVYFPFADSAEGLKDKIKERKINQTVPQVVTIISRLKPYKGGNKSLRGLHDLDVLDKHRTIISVFDTAHIEWGASWTETISLDGKPIVSIWSAMLTSGPLKHDEPVAGFPTGVPVKGEWYPPIISIVFKEGPFEGQTIIPTLIQLTELVERILKMLEPYG